MVDGGVCRVVDGEGCVGWWVERGTCIPYIVD